MFSCSHNAHVRVLSIGPPPGDVGGMAVIGKALEGSRARRGVECHCRCLASGGGNGKRGYFRFIASLCISAIASYDVMHLHTASRGSFLRKLVFAVVAVLRNRPFILHLHGGGFVDYYRGCSQRWQLVIRRTFRRADSVIVLGDEWRDFVTECLGVAASRVRVIENGVKEPSRSECAATCRDYPWPFVLFLGSISREKGVDLVLKAIIDLGQQENLTDWHWVLAGPVLDPDLVNQVRSINRGVARGRVHVVGPVTGSAKNRLLLGASVFVLPSRAEALPLALLEAMAAGLACVCSPVGSIPDVIVHRENGFLVAADGPNSLSGLLRCVMADEALRGLVGEAAHGTWERRFQQSAMLDRVADTWIAVASGHAYSTGARRVRR